MAGHVADYAHEQRIAEAAQRGYAGSYLEAQGQGLRLGLEHYGFQEGEDARLFMLRHDGGREKVAAKARRRADLECLTQAVYYEARGESSRGQYAVAQVVMNRVKHPAFPKSVCAVVFQGAGHRGCQFSFACDGSMRRGQEGRRGHESEAWDRARAVATRTLAGAALADIGSATHFHTAAVAPMWAPHMLRVSQVGMHVFYRFSPHKLRAVPGLSPLPGVETAVLTSGPADAVPELRIPPATVEKAIEASLEPASAADAKATKVDTKAKPAAVAPAPAPAPAEAAMLAPAQAAAVTAS
ncbi:MAG: cell wall hydrolase [Phenylobacterium sp.]|nr:cell wall hydrolase [Phenylobacterium sp.]